MHLMKRMRTYKNDVVARFEGTVVDKSAVYFEAAEGDSLHGRHGHKGNVMKKKAEVAKQPVGRNPFDNQIETNSPCWSAGIEG